MFSIERLLLVFGALEKDESSQKVGHYYTREALRETSKWMKKELFGSFIIFLLVACAQH